MVPKLLNTMSMHKKTIYLMNVYNYIIKFITLATITIVALNVFMQKRTKGQTKQETPLKIHYCQKTQ